MSLKFWKQPASFLGPGILAALTLLAAPAPAQGPYGQPPGRAGRPPFGRPPFGRPPFGAPHPVTLATAPLSALSAGLNLTGDQQDKIARLKQQLRQKKRAAFEPPPVMMALEQQAVGSIQNILTAAQRQSLPRLLKTFNALHAAGIPLTAYSGLKLTPAQTEKLAGLAPSHSMPNPKLRAKVIALLTERQREQAEEAHDPGPGGPPPFPPGGRPPGQRGGGRGGFGPPPDGFGPPPPDGF